MNVLNNIILKIFIFRYLKMINREIIDDKKLKAIFSYIDTLHNVKQIKMMFMFNYLAGMRCINFYALQLKDIIDDNDSIML